MSERNKSAGKAGLLGFITDILVCACLGIIIDFVADTRFIFTIVGLVAGLVLAVVLKKLRERKDHTDGQEN